MPFRGEGRYSFGWNFFTTDRTSNRSDYMKELRMSRFVAWRRDRIKERVRIHLMVAGGVFFGIPLVIIVASWLWRAAIESAIG